MWNDVWLMGNKDGLISTLAMDHPSNLKVPNLIDHEGGSWKTDIVTK